MRPDYRIYPSLLDKFQSLIDYELEAEEPWNTVSDNAHRNGKYLDKETGDYILSPDEMYTRIEAELIDTINRCPRVPVEAADKGTAFNEVIDCLIENRRSSRDDCRIHSERLDSATTAIIAEINGFTFAYDAAFCKEVAAYFKGSIPQYLTSAILPTRYGNVELYGFIDEWMPSRICDIKTTSSYTFGKYGRKWQRHVYPYCCIESGMTSQVDEFEYTVVQWDRNPVLKGKIYREVYTYDHRKSAERLTGMAERFIHWLNFRKAFITDSRIFGGENPQGYAGTPIDRTLLT